MSITERLVNKELYVPFEDDDPERATLVNEIIENQTEIIRLESEIALLKAQMKPHTEDLDNALNGLTKGQKKFTACKESIFWDENRIETVRLDTLEKLPNREINEEDRKCHTDDVDVE
jgi:hypothetical protein